MVAAARGGSPGAATTAAGYGGAKSWRGGADAVSGECAVGPIQMGSGEGGGATEGERGSWEIEGRGCAGEWGLWGCRSS